jgi:Protein of unknown function (DUF3108)
MMKLLLVATACAALCAAPGLDLGAQQPPAPPKAAAGTAIGPLAQIRPAPPGYAFPDGQSFVYEAEWRLWNAGTARITVEQAGANQRISVSADGSGVVALLYPVHDRFQSIFNPQSFCSIGVTKHTEEGFRSRETLINFNYARRRAVLDETNLKNSQTKHEEHEIPGCVTDVLSGILYLGSLPLTSSATYYFPLNDGGNTVEVRAHVEAREAVKTPAGSFPTIRVSPEAASGVLKDRGRVWIWYSDDTRRIPVQMRARMFWGTLTFRLTRIEKK